MARLTAAKVRTAGAGRYSDGGTLTLLVTKRGGRSWVQRLTINGRRADVGLGPASVVSLQMARDRALENRRRLWNGEDPRTGRPAAAASVAAPVSTAPTFREAAAAVLEANRGAWRNSRSASVWGRMLERHAYPAIGNKRVDAIGRADVLRVLSPVMLDTPPTGRKLRQNVRQVFAWAQAHGHITENPAGEVIAAALPKAPAVKAHRKAAPYRETGAMLRTVEASTIAAAVKACFAFIVLTGVRTNEARGARWSEIDTAAGTWKIPGKRMKEGRGHRVPLSDAALAVLERAAGLIDGSGLLFPSPVKRGQPISRSAMLMALRRLGIAVDVHGFRSSLRDWCAETGEPREVAEAALSHVNGGTVEASYFRSDLFDKRRELMGQWAQFVTGG